MFLFAICLFSLSASADKGVEVFFYDNYFPYSYEEQGEAAGLFVLLTKAIMDRTSLDPTYRIYPFKRALALGAQGTGLVSGLYKTPNRERHFHYSRPYYTEDLILLSGKRLPETLVESGFAPLKGWDVGLLYGMSYGPDIDAAIENGTIRDERVEDDLMNYRKLKRGRIDGAIMRRVMAQKLINENQDGDLIIHPEPLLRGDVHIAVGKAFQDSERILEQIDAALLEIKQDGSYQKVLDEFIGK